MNPIVTEAANLVRSVDALVHHSALLADNLREAVDKFREYASIHAAKGTEEGYHKAGVNAALAAKFETTLEAFNGLYAKPPVEEPWTPCGGNWIEVPNVEAEMPSSLSQSSLVDVLLKLERVGRVYSSVPAPAHCFVWDQPYNSMYRIVAYKLATKNQF